jgi:hypothetical protein
MPKINETRLPRATKHVQPTDWIGSQFTKVDSDMTKVTTIKGIASSLCRRGID